MSTRELPRHRRDDDGEAIIAAIEEVGAVIIEDLLTECRIASLLAEVQTHIDDADPDMKHVNTSDHTRPRNQAMS